MTSKTLQTISETSKTDFLYRKTSKSIYWVFSGGKNLLSQEPQKRIFYIGKHRNPYIGHFQVTKTRDFSNFLKITLKLTSFLTSCSVVWRQQHLKQSQEPQKQIFLHRKTFNAYIGHFQVTKTRDFSNFLKIIHKLTYFFNVV